MPQPLTRLVPDGKFIPNWSVLDDKPEMSALVAGIFGVWGYIERDLGLLLVNVLGADAEPAIAMFSTLTAQHLQMGALEAAARTSLSPDVFDVFDAATCVVESVQADRNRLAHWIWGSCDALPDALLLADPKSHKERSQKRMAAMPQQSVRDANKLVREHPIGEWVNVMIQMLEQNKFEPYDPSSVLVYTQDDLRRVKRDTVSAQKIMSTTTLYLHFFRTKGPIEQLGAIFASHPPEVWAQVGINSTVNLRWLGGEMLRILCGERLFREAYDRIRENRKTPLPEPPPERPQVEGG
jgi:hypothetical protein